MNRAESGYLNSPDLDQTNRPEIDLAEAKELLREPSVKKFAGKLKRILLIAGLAAALDACGGLTRQEVKEIIPEVPVEDLAKDLPKYKDLQTIKTRGIPEFVGEKIDHSIGFGPGGLKAVDKKIGYFELRSNNSDSAAAINMIAEGESKEYGSLLDMALRGGPKSPQFGAHEYTILGKVVTSTDKDNKNQKLYFKSTKIIDATSAEVNEK